MRMTAFLALGALTLAPSVSTAQVSGTIVVGGLPVAGVIRFGPPPYGAYYRARPRMVIYGYAPHVIVVERWRGNKHRDDWRHMRYRPVWYDRDDDRYYDGYRPGLVEVEVSERDGRYYRPNREDREERYDDRRGRRGRQDRDGWHDPDRR